MDIYLQLHGMSRVNVKWFRNKRANYFAYIQCNVYL